VSKSRPLSNRVPGVPSLVRMTGRSNAANGHTAGGALTGTIAVIEARALFRDCLVQAFQAEHVHDVVGFQSVDDALKTASKRSIALSLLSIPASAEVADLRDCIKQLVTEAGSAVAVVASIRKLHLVKEVFEMGAVGFITTDLPIAVCIGATRLLLAGGQFIPAGILLEAGSTNHPRFQQSDLPNKKFSDRQIAVLKAVSKGKANKAIAMELKMQEGTVKVHIRNLMKSLNVHNRTEVALAAVEILRLIDEAGIALNGKRTEQL